MKIALSEQRKLHFQKPKIALSKAPQLHINDSEISDLDEKTRSRAFESVYPCSEVTVTVNSCVKKKIGRVLKEPGPNENFRNSGKCSEEKQHNQNEERASLLGEKQEQDHEPATSAVLDGLPIRDSNLCRALEIHNCVPAQRIVKGQVVSEEMNLRCAEAAFDGWLEDGRLALQQNAVPEPLSVIQFLEKQVDYCRLRGELLPQVLFLAMKSLRRGLGIPSGDGPALTLRVPLSPPVPPLVPAPAAARTPFLLSEKDRTLLLQAQAYHKSWMRATLAQDASEATE
jgi:hypothetical protein